MQPPFRVAHVQVFYQRASVYDAHSGIPLFLVDLSLPGGNGRIQRGCERRGYEAPQLRTNARGTLRLQKRLPGARCTPRSECRLSGAERPFLLGKSKPNGATDVHQNGTGCLPPSHGFRHPL